MIKPSIGRVVWFTPPSNSASVGFAAGAPLAAIVAHVHSDRCVNLGVFDANGVAHSRCSVPLLQDDDAAPGGGYYAEWMPFQKGQAAKQDAAASLTQQIAPSDGFSFSAALIHIKDGGRVSRKAWPSGVFVYYVPPASYPVQTGAAKAHFGEGSVVPYLAYLAIKRADDTVCVFNPGMDSLLAEDWHVIE